MVLCRITSLVSMGPSPRGFCMQNSDFRNSYNRFPDLICVLNTHNRVCIRITRISSLPVVLSQRCTCPYCSLPSSVVFACKPATFGPELQVSMGTRPHLSLCACITAPFGTELQVSMGSSPHLWFCALKTATLELKLYVSMGPRPHLWYCACKTACLASE